MVNESGIEPVGLLSKTDLLDPEELAEKFAEVQSRMPNVRLYAFSNADQHNLEEVMDFFQPGKTYCVVGTSGVGKTTLLNHLLGEERNNFV